MVVGRVQRQWACLPAGVLRVCASSRALWPTTQSCRLRRLANSTHRRCVSPSSAGSCSWKRHLQCRLKQVRLPSDMKLRKENSLRARCSHGCWLQQNLTVQVAAAFGFAQKLHRSCSADDTLLYRLGIWEPVKSSSSINCRGKKAMKGPVYGSSCIANSCPCALANLERPFVERQHLHNATVSTIGSTNCKRP